MTEERRAYVELVADVKADELRVIEKEDVRTRAHAEEWIDSRIEAHGDDSRSPAVPH